MTKDWFHGVGHCPVCQILLQIVVRAVITSSLPDTNERGLRLLEFATFNDLVLVNTFGHHKASRRWTWHSPNGQHHNQIDYILVRKR
ncbi:hypothetical protein, partial [Thiolapillus sp.]|uniref:hypothetical protein n=1 Tax=Thiolapillus sp. TaxID=2017437 RepID=UPI0025E56F3E